MTDVGPARWSPWVELLGVRVDVVGKQGLLTHIARAVETGRGSLIANVNIHAMNLAFVDSGFRTILNSSDLVFVDGYGVILGARLAGLRLGERLTFMDWMDDLFRLCALRQWPVFALGDTEEVGAAFERRLAERHPGCPFAGHHHGFFDTHGSEGDAVVSKINASGAAVLLVGMGMPVQEKWLWANRDSLTVPVRLTSGAFYRFYTGITPRGPERMTQHGLEWLHRLSLEPKTLWRRYLVGNPLFLMRVGLERLKGRQAEGG